MRVSYKLQYDGKHILIFLVQAAFAVSVLTCTNLSASATPSLSPGDSETVSVVPLLSAGEQLEELTLSDTVEDVGLSLLCFHFEDVLAKLLLIMVRRQNSRQRRGRGKC